MVEGCNLVKHFIMGGCGTLIACNQGPCFGHLLQSIFRKIAGKLKRGCWVVYDDKHLVL